MEKINKDILKTLNKKEIKTKLMESSKKMLKKNRKAYEALAYR